MANRLKDKLFPSKESQEKEYRELYARTEDLPDSLINYPFDEEKSGEWLRKRFLEGCDDTSVEVIKSDQSAKADAGKLQITLVPRQIIRDIARVRMYGNKKYGSSDNWKEVEIERYRDALCRHLLAYLDDPDSKDEESGLYHYQHLACNMAFICEMEKWRHGEKM